MAAAFTLAEHQQIAAIARQALEAVPSSETAIRLDAMRLAVQQSMSLPMPETATETVARARAFADFILGMLTTGAIDLPSAASA